MSFNEAQTEAIHHKEGPLLIIAGPGSGKTTVIVNRTKNLIEEHHIDPRKILVVTFTKSAAEEMGIRFQKLCLEEEDPDQYTGVHFGTIHSICFQILVSYFGYDYSQLIQENEKYRILYALAKQYDFASLDYNKFIADIAKAIGYIKNCDGKDINYSKFDVSEYQVKKMMKGYQEVLEKEHKIDFDDMLLRCRDNLKKHEDVLADVQETFHYIMIDEFQDTNNVQAEIFNIIAEKRKNICVVGDDDQSLYRFRGAKPEIMLDFEKTYPKTKKVVLNINYRSDCNIVAASKKFIEYNKTRFPKDIKSFHKRRYKIQLHQLPNDKEQNTWIIKKINELYKKGVPYSEMAVIYRTNRESKTVIDQLVKKDIPFQAKIEDVINIYNHFIFNDILNFMELAKGSKSMARWTRALKRPTAYIPNDAFKECKSLDDLKQWGFDHGKPYIKKNIEAVERKIRKLKVLDFKKQVGYIKRTLNYEEGLISYAEYKGEDETLLLEILDDLEEDSKECDSMKEWQQRAKEYTATIKRTVSIDEEKDAVNLTTMHGSKGLEYQVVFMIDVNEGITPYEKAETVPELEEERRMFYVGMTRAKERLFIISTDQFRGKDTVPSDYYYELQNILEKKES